MPNINFYSPQTGRRIKEDNSIVNTADMIEAIYNKIVNGQVDMQLSGSIGKQQIYAEKTGSVAINTELTVIDKKEPCVIDYLEFSTNNVTEGQLRVLSYVNNIATPWSILASNGIAPQPITPTFINDHGTGLFDILIYDVTGNKFKFGTRRQLYFPEGVRITVKNRSTTAEVNVACVVIGRTSP